MTMAALCALAVPANRQPQVFTQPDGTQLTLRLVGDEFFHYYLTESGDMALQGPDGAFYLAEPALDGTPAISSRLVGSKGQTAEQRVAMIDAGSKKAAAKRARRDRAMGMRAPMQASEAAWPSGIGLFPNNTYPVTGSPRAAIILVAFSDVAMNSRSQAYFTDMASKVGFKESGSTTGSSSPAATGSALDYFTASSNGKFTPQFDVLGPVKLSNTCAYYGGNDSYGNDLRPEYMVRDAIKALDATTDFSVYDNDHDGVIDNVYVIYAGMGEANGGAANTIWPHSWSFSEAGLSLTVDGKKVDSYACSAEFYSKTLLDGIGTFCHEFSHVMGLPDLYDTVYGTAERYTPGDYSLMDQGSYLNSSRTPPTYGIYERNAMGWADVEVLDPGVGVDASLGHILNTNMGYAIATEKTNEFFLLENRQKTGWDAYLPGHGMLIWHIDYNTSIWNANKPNNSATHQYVDIVEAGGTANNTSSSTLAQYPFPGTKNKTSFTSSTTPAMRSWAGKNIDAPITDIAEANGMITFKVCGGAPSPSTIPAPLCNFSQPTVSSDEPVVVTLSLAPDAESSDVIMYMIDDDDDIIEERYSGPITISKSSEMIYWAQRGSETSEVITIKFRIGAADEPMKSYTITFNDNDTDASSEIKATDFASYCLEGADAATLNSESTKVFKGTTGLKLGSSKAAGTLLLDIAPAYQAEVESVVVNAKKYGNDSPKLAVNGAGATSLTSDLEDYVFPQDGSELKQIKIDSTSKRMYVKSITVNLAQRNPSGIADVTVVADAEAVYYDLQGIRCATPAPGRIYIEVRGAKARKVVF